MSQSNILKGTMMLTGANYLSKILGLLYVIPFFALVSESGGALYSYAYNPYQIFLTISSLGVPMAMSKFVAKYNALEDYRTKQAVFKSGLWFMAVTGVVTFLIMFFTADWLAQLFVPESGDFSNSTDDVAFVIKMVSIALIVVAPMSLVRGYFQGHASMGPSAISMVAEQIVRIGFLLAAAFVVLKVFEGTITLAVGLAAFAAFIGAIASSAILIYIYRKRRPEILREVEQTNVSESPDKRDLYQELLSYAGPFILVGIATPLYQMVDQLTFNRAMASVGMADVSESMLSVIIVYGHKLVIIPVTLSIGLAMALLPSITEAFTKGDATTYRRYISQALLIVMLFIFPAAIGLSILADEAYGTLYAIDEANKYAGSILAVYAPVSLFFALFTVSASMLQGVNRQNFTLLSLAVGLIIKIALNVPMITMFEAEGAVMATGLGVLTAGLLNLTVLYRTTHFELKPLFKKSLLIVILTVIMALVVIITRYLVGLPFSGDISKLQVIVQLFTSVIIGGYVYLWLAYKTTLLERLMGDRVHRLKKIFI
ncbi:putative polysaccharide biosynthesis protein [Alkalibacillus almallahensis]|uniref:putative polysaccharide biosynthesis protein n=1 Tax=Alkalibacillus almallahensis TaxID=1379154 RepID=UPI00141DE0C0|nr:polysaccharide biosynthesis protein [Alkalibacillus almallahensis]NIK13455.1 O-antigen/teichoic acid export membrane protein [Alkalibacillus almallahensis]